MDITPLPWRVLAGTLIEQDKPEPEYAHYIGNVLEKPFHEMRANAQFIVHACNSHYELLEQLEIVTQKAENMAELLVGSGFGYYDARVTDWLEKAKAVIAKARSET